MLKEKKTLHEKELSPYLIVSMIVEMMLDGNLEIADKNKVVLTDRIPTADYNLKLYDIIKNMKKEELNNKLKDIEYTEIAQKVKAAQSVINTMIALVTTLMINASTSGI